MVILYASSHGSGLRSTSHIFPVNDHNDIDQNWDYISFLMFIGIKELLYNRFGILTLMQIINKFGNLPEKCILIHGDVT